MANKLIDIEKLSRYHDNLKEVLNTKETAGAAAQALADAKADAANLYQIKGNYEEAGAAAEALDAAKEYVDELVTDGSGNSKFDTVGSASTAEQNAKDYADDLVKNEDGSVKFDDKGAAATAEQNAKDYADGLAGNYDAAGTAESFNTAMDERVVKLEAIDHDKIVADAIAAVVAGAESDFDTLKEVADWINNDTTGAAALQVTVSEHSDAIESLSDNKQDNIADLETIRTGAAAGAIAEQNAKDYADDLVKNEDGSVKFDDKGAAAQALADAKADAANLYQEKGDYLIPSDLEFATDDEIDGLFA